TLLRNCQDAQSVGIPIGPDVSLLLAEILLSRVDEVLGGAGIRGIRYIDDYELVFESERDALKAKSVLQSALLEYELDLNASKTRIVPLPQELEESWVGSLRAVKLKPYSNHFEKQLIRFFDHAFQLSKEFPNEGVLKYAAGRIAKLPIHLTGSDELIENLLIQCAQVEPGALAVVLGSILKRPSVSAETQRLRSRMLLRIILDAAPQRHSSEVAWALWACLVLGVELNREATQAIVSMEDSVCALLALHAKEEGLVREPKDLAPLRDDLDGAALYSPKWMLAYEAPRKGWFRFTGARDYIANDPNFSLLKGAGVFFYDKQKAVIPDNLVGTQRASFVDEYVSGLTETDYDSEDDEEDYWDDEEEYDSLRDGDPLTEPE
ncbi:MAG: RNA-directed DNA polymerase, partial [Verrucomicrobiales bacterium]